MVKSENGTRQPTMIAERKPLRPVRTAAVRAPIKVTKPISLADGVIEVASLPLRRGR